MSDDENKPDETKAKTKSELVTVQIVRAVGAYHHRGAVIQVPNDKYHKALLRGGLLKKVG